MSTGMGRGALAWTVAAGLSAAAALAGCGVARSEFRDERSGQAVPSEINLDGGSGSVTIRNGDMVRIKRHVSYLGTKPGATDRMDGSVLKLNTDCGRNCSVDYDITTPAGVRVSGRDGSGSVDLSGVSSVAISVGSGRIVVRQASGDVNVETGSGEIETTDVKGAVAAKTGSGGIRLSEIAGQVTAETGSGDVRGTGLAGPTTIVRTASGGVTLDLTKAQDVTARTASGGIRVTVPSGDKYRVTATTSSGRTNVGVPDEPAGEHKLDLHTDSGGITVVTK